MTQAQAAMLFLEHQERLFTATLAEDRTAHPIQRERITRKLEHAFYVISTCVHPKIVIEIGAHAAEYSRRMKRAMPNSRVVAFEANPDVFSMYKNVVLNAGVEYYNTAVADRSGRMTITIPVTNGQHKVTMGSILPNTDQPDGYSAEVDCCRLDDFTDTQEATIWIDVEGAAGLVVNGGRETLKHAKALYMEVETRPVWAGQQTDQEVLRTVVECGLVPIARDIYRHKWQYNVLCVRPEELENPIIGDVIKEYLGGDTP